MKYLSGDPDWRQTLLLDLFRAALSAVDGYRCVKQHLLDQPIEGPVRAVAIGKAAESMLGGAVEALGPKLEQSLLITKTGHVRGRLPAGTGIIESGHPLPDDNSLSAGARLLEFLAAGPADGQWLFLISGGASSLVEVPVAGVGLADLHRLNRWLLASGLPITEMNALRRRLSRIKGGRLLAHLCGRPTRALLISDVPGDDPAIIGSGLLFPPGDEPALERALLPDWLQSLLAQVTAPETSVTAPASVRAEIVASLDRALDAAAAVASAAGLPVYRAASRLEGDAAQTGRELAEALLSGAPGVYLWGGETTVRLPEHPGQGGRCQHLALAAAEILAGQDGIALLAAGTDGSDGSGAAAGACVDGQTLARGRAEGLDARNALAQADAGGFLAAAGDLLDTGPTGTNVTDVVIGIKTAGT
jgi:glycerate 2-kinase